MPTTEATAPCPELTVHPVAPFDLYHRYPGQHEPQPAYVEIDLVYRMVHADYDGEIGNAVPACVWHGFARRYAIPPLTSTEANGLLEQIAPWASRMCADWYEHWDGHNLRARLGDEAQAAEAAVMGLVATPGAWDEETQVSAWGIDGATTGEEADLYNITAQTSDEELDAIADDILHVLAKASGADEVLLDREVTDHLESLRDDLADQTRTNP